MLQAGKDWRWEICAERNRLVLKVDSAQDELVLPYKIRQLNQFATQGADFSLQDASMYEQVSQYLNSFVSWTDGEIAVISLHATAAKNYLNPVLAKSWFFKPYHGQIPSTEAVVELNSNNQVGRFLIVECDSENSLCMCLESSMQLDEHFSLSRFETIKVLNDRIYPVLLKQSHLKRA
jgi:cell division protein ZapC